MEDPFCDGTRMGARGRRRKEEAINPWRKRRFRGDIKGGKWKKDKQQIAKKDFRRWRSFDGQGRIADVVMKALKGHQNKNNDARHLQMVLA